jgi:hypothetical protein
MMAIDESRRASGAHSLFVRHFNEGEALFQAGRLPEAARELEEAYLLRPRDHRVLNLLGLIYFKQEELERAEEIYRKLVAESPDSHTLFYNLGLVYLKLSRVEEAERSLLRSLELAGSSPKVHFYLGSIYERMERLQDAIFHYRQAGTSGFARQAAQAAQRTAGPQHPPAPPVPATPPTAVAPARRPGDTAPFARVPERTTPLTSAPEHTTPLTPVPEDKASVELAADEEDTRPMRPLDDAALAAEIPEGFRLLQPDLLEVRSRNKAFVRQGTIHSYAGNLRFWVREQRPHGEPGIAIVTGAGRLLLRDGEREIRLVPLQDGRLFVRPQRLLACQAGLTPTWITIGQGEDAVEFLRLEGRGVAAVSVGSRPLTLEVTPALPASVAIASVLHWSGSLEARTVSDENLAAVLHPDRRQAGPLGMLRLEGTGEVSIEQA